MTSYVALAEVNQNYNTLPITELFNYCAWYINMCIIIIKYQIIFANCFSLANKFHLFHTRSRNQWHLFFIFCQYFLMEQDNVRTNTESVQCHHVFDIAYLAPTLRGHVTSSIM